MAGHSKICLKLVRVAPSLNCDKKTQTRRRRHGARYQASGYLSISHVKSQSLGGLQFWLLAVNDAMDFSFSLFLKAKDQMARVMILLIKELRNTENIVVKKI